MALLTIYKSFTWPHLNCEDIIYYKAFNESFHAKLESLHYSVTLAIAESIRGISTEKNYEERCLETLKTLKILVQKMSLRYKLLKIELPSYIFNAIPNCNTERQMRHSDNVPSLFVKHENFKDSFSFCNK